MVPKGGADPPWQPYESRFLAGGIGHVPALRLAAAIGVDPIYQASKAQTPRRRRRIKW